MTAVLELAGTNNVVVGGSYGDIVFTKVGATNKPARVRGLRDGGHGNVVLAFDTYDLERMRIDAGGNVGIGTDAPDSMLHLSSATESTLTLENTSSQPSLKLYNSIATPAADTELGRLNFKGKNDAAEETSYAQVHGYVVDDTDGSENGYLAFLTMNAGSVTEKMRVDTDGKIGIGDADTDGTLTITGYTDISALNTDGQGGIVIQEDAANATGYKMRIDPNEIQVVDNGVAANLILQPFGGNIVVANAGGTTKITGLSEPTASTHAATKNYVDVAVSDKRLKNSVEPMDGFGLDTVMSLRPVSYLWNNPTDAVTEGTQYGFIAQEIEKVLPDLIVEQDDEMKTKT
ncbi:MAG: tail fiber domain-containing protein, partial [Bdellovibrionales bacterium]